MTQNKHADQNKKKKSSSKKLFLWLFICVALVVAIVVVVGLFYQSPSKTMNTAIGNLLGSKSVGIELSGITKQGEDTTTSSIKSDTRYIDGVTTSKVTVKASAPTQTEGGAKSFETTTDTYADSEQSFTRMHNPEKYLADVMMPMTAISPDASQEMKDAYEGMQAGYVEMGKKMDGKWMATDEEDITDAVAVPDASVCSFSFSAYFAYKADDRKKLADSYAKHPFFTIDEDTELDKKDGSLGYRLAVDDDIYKEYKKSVKDVEAVKSIDEGCRDNILTFGVKDGSVSRVDIWVDRLTRSITNVSTAREINTGATLTEEMKFSYGVDALFGKPQDKDIIKMEDVMSPAQPQPVE